MKTYIATLTFVQFSRAEVSIMADSLEEAGRKAAEIGSDEAEWIPVNGEVSVESVVERRQPKEGGQ